MSLARGPAPEDHHLCAEPGDAREGLPYRSALQRITPSPCKLSPIGWSNWPARALKIWHASSWTLAAGNADYQQLRRRARDVASAVSQLGRPGERGSKKAEVAKSSSAPEPSTATATSRLAGKSSPTAAPAAKKDEAWPRRPASRNFVATAPGWAWVLRIAFKSTTWNYPLRLRRAGRLGVKNGNGRRALRARWRAPMPSPQD